MVERMGAREARNQFAHLLVRSGGPARVLDAWRERRYVLILSPAIVAEIRAALNYPRMRPRL
jgi:predicted nucleic acid-binding protein